MIPRAIRRALNQSATGCHKSPNKVLHASLPMFLVGLNPSLNPLRQPLLVTYLGFRQLF